MMVLSTQGSTVILRLNLQGFETEDRTRIHRMEIFDPFNSTKRIEDWAQVWKLHVSVHSKYPQLKTPELMDWRQIAVPKCTVLNIPKSVNQGKSGKSGISVWDANLHSIYNLLCLCGYRTAEYQNQNSEVF